MYASTSGGRRRVTWWLSLVAKLAITALLFWLLLARAPVETVLAQTRSISAGTIGLLAFGLFLLSATTALRWMMVLRSLGTRLGFAPLWRYVIVGMFFNQFLPSGSGGDVFRIWYVRSTGISLGRATASVVVDRVLGLLALFAVVAVGVPFVLDATEDGLIRSMMFLIAVALAVAIGAFLRMDVLANLLRRVGLVVELEKRHARAKRLLDGIERTASAARGLLRAWPEGPFAFGLSVVNQVILGAVVWILAREVGADPGFAAAMFMFPYVLLLSMVPVSLAGWGLREGAMVVVFTLVGMPPAAALTVSLLFGACQLVASLPGGLLWLQGHRRLTRDQIAEIGHGIEAVEPTRHTTNHP